MSIIRNNEWISMNLKRAAVFLLIPSCLFSAAKFDGSLAPAALDAAAAFGRGGVGGAAARPMTLCERMMAEGPGFFEGKYTSEQLHSVMLEILNFIVRATDDDESREIYTKGALLLVSNGVPLPSDREISHSFKCDAHVVVKLGIGEEVQAGRYFHAMHSARGIVQRELGREVADAIVTAQGAEKVALLALPPEVGEKNAVYFVHVRCAAKWLTLRNAYGAAPLRPPSPAKNAQILAKAFYGQGATVPSRGVPASTCLPLRETGAVAGAVVRELESPADFGCRGSVCSAAFGSDPDNSDTDDDALPAYDPLMSGAGDSPCPWERGRYGE